METFYLLPADFFLRNDLEKFLLKEEDIKQLDKIPPLIPGVFKREIRVYHDRHTSQIYFIINDRNEDSSEIKTLSLSSQDLGKY